MKILVTGAAGFIGSSYVRQVLKAYPEDEIVSLDSMTYAGNPANLSEFEQESRHRFVQGDIADSALVDDLIGNVDAVVNFAAESHVDRSLLDPESFLRTNVQAVYTLLDAVKRHGKRMVQVSTDEVYGTVPEGEHTAESHPLKPRSPYSASKAGAELFCQSFFVSFGTDVLITRGSNTIGPRQYPEKVIPLFVTNALMDQSLPVYGDGLQIRDWMHAEDHAAGIDLVLRKGRSGESYNVGAGNDRPNIDMVRLILERLGKPESLIAWVPDRAGHDRRYSMTMDKIQSELGWSPKRNFEQTLNDTIDWYVNNPEWWQAIRQGSPEFQKYYNTQYGWRLEAATSGKEAVSGS
ncbi:MAG: dTDP-glucose 4,6-dehydratase [Thermomicrobiales bacterium]